MQSEGFSDWTKSKHANALYTYGMFGNKDVEFILPETFMNKSGETIRYVVNKHGAKAEEFIVIHDDIDLPFGEIKIGKDRGAGGNNGIKSIIKALGTKDFTRVRVGIAPKSFLTGKMKRPKGGGPLEKFVLKPFAKREEKELGDLITLVTAALKTILEEGVEAAMNQYH